MSEEKVHFMPCTIDHNGQAKVKKYFKVEENPDVKGNLRTSFRGRPLDGRDVKLPAGYQGIILQEKNEILSDVQERHMEVCGTFDHFTHWNLDKLPTKNDALINAFDWIKVAHVLHEPVKSTKKECKEENEK